MENIDSSHASVTVSWNPPINAQNAALQLAFYDVALFDSKGSRESANILVARQDATQYTDILPSRNDTFQYIASIIAENKCGQRSEEFTIVCKSSSSISSYHISIITVTIGILCTIL
jgi:hypothetical protein